MSPPDEAPIGGGSTLCYLGHTVGERCGEGVYCGGASKMKVVLGKAMDPKVLAHIEQLFDGQNLKEAVINSHLLIEVAITANIAKKFSRPDIILDPKWTFQQKLGIFIGLFDPPNDFVDLINSLGRLRNIIAHRLDDEEEAVKKCFPMKGKRPSSLHLIVNLACTLLMKLGAIKMIFTDEFASRFPHDPKWNDMFSHASWDGKRSIWD